MSILFFLIFSIITPAQSNTMTASPQQSEAEEVIVVLKARDEFLKKKYPTLTRYQRQLEDCNEQLKKQVGAEAAMENAQVCISHAENVTDLLGEK